jgi:site-specific DNA recombinase
MRTERGKRDRLKNGNLPGGGKPSYGYQFADTNKEPAARYVLNETIIYTDPETNEQWSEVTVVLFLFNSIADGVSMGSIARTLTKMGIPTPGGDGKYWRPGTIVRILRNPIYTGNAVSNRFQKVTMKTTSARAKSTEVKRLVARPEEEHIHLPDGTIPAIVTQDVFDLVQMQLTLNKQESIRNNNHAKEELGILRAGYCHCGVCGKTMKVRTHNNHRKPEYYCRTKTGRPELDHTTSILLDILDPYAWKKAVEVMKNPCIVRARIDALRKENKPEIDREDIETTIATIKKQMGNLIKFAQNATDDDALDQLTFELKDLEQQKRKAEALIYDFEEDEEERDAIEAEIVKFEQWIGKVAPKLTDPSYQPTYEEMRLAVRIMGIHAVVFPIGEEYPLSYVDAQPPRIMNKLERKSVLLSPMTDHKRGPAGVYAVRDSWPGNRLQA